MVPVTEGHEVSRGKTVLQDQYAHHILSEIAEGRPISQRSLAGSLGIALGMTNLLLRGLVRRGLVRVSRIRPNRVAYFLTPKGMAEKARMSRDLFQRSVRVYASARDRIRASFESLSRDWPDQENGARKRILFLGTGEAAEIGYVCLQETDLELIGVIDFQGRKRFFGVPVFSAHAITDEARELIQEAQPIVVSFADVEPNHRVLEEAGVPPDRVCWI
jgi:DNA-binding MarR family transcriptional regulator